MLLLDCGDAFKNDKDTAEFMLKAMELMKYDALNLGAAELQLGPGFLDRSRTLISFPYIASNLLYRGSKPPWADEYLIKTAGDIRVAVFGIVDPDDLSKSLTPEQAEVLQATAPEAALNRLLPKVRKKVDVVILLSRLNTAEQLSLLESVKGIDVSISSDKAKGECKKGVCNTIKTSETSGANPPGETLRLAAEARGGAMGLLKIKLADKRMLPVEHKEVLMGSSISDDEKVARLIKEYRELQAKKEEERQQKLMDDLRLTPQEFMESYRREQQAEREKGGIE